MPRERHLGKRWLASARTRAYGVGLWVKIGTTSRSVRLAPVRQKRPPLLAALMLSRGEGAHATHAVSYCRYRRVSKKSNRLWSNRQCSTPDAYKPRLRYAKPLRPRL